MFGLSKKERYERDVKIALTAMMCDFGDLKDEKIVPSIKIKYSKYWDSIMKEGVEIGNSPETTALVMAVIFYQDVLNNHASQEELDTIRQSIIEKNDEFNEDSGILFRMKFSFLMGSRWSSKEIPRDVFLLALRDIHRAIFDDDDEHLDDTIHYLIEGGNRYADYMKGVAGASREQ